MQESITGTACLYTILTPHTRYLNLKLARPICYKETASPLTRLVTKPVDGYQDLGSRANHDFNIVPNSWYGDRTGWGI